MAEHEGSEVVAEVDLPADLSAVTTQQLRDVAAAAGETEAGLSYLRRLVQGRVDIVRAEDQRRRDGQPPGDVTDLIRQLPTILGDHPPRTGRGRHFPPVAPDDVDPVLVSRFDHLVSPDALAHLPDVDASDLDVMIRGLSNLEGEISGRRRELHHLIDRVHLEIGRRYATGEISPGDVITRGEPSNGGPPG